MSKGAPVDFASMYSRVIKAKALKVAWKPVAGGLKCQQCNLVAINKNGMLIHIARKHRNE